MERLGRGTRSSERKRLSKGIAPDCGGKRIELHSRGIAKKRLAKALNRPGSRCKGEAKNE